jgi:hypothetical protein
MPTDFPTAEYNAFHAVANLHTPSGHPMMGHYYGGIMAMAYRFCSVRDAEDDLTTAMAGPESSDRRYIESKAFYMFFAAGLSSIESFLYALYALGQARGAPHFRLLGGATDHRVTPEETQRVLAADYPGAPVEQRVTSLLASAPFQEWKNARNYLSHRVQPARTINMTQGNAPRPPDEMTVAGVTMTVEPATLRTRRQWLSGELRNLLVDAARWA